MQKARKKETGSSWMREDRQAGRPTGRVHGTRVVYGGIEGEWGRGERAVNVD